jgi:hypothetical protein
MKNKCVMCDDVASCYSCLKQELDTVKEKLSEAVDSFRFCLSAAEVLYRPDYPVQEGLSPTAYHTLSAEGDAVLAEKTRTARKVFGELKGLKKA